MAAVASSKGALLGLVGPTTGDLLMEYPEISAIVLAESGWSESELRAWSYGGAGSTPGTCSSYVETYSCQGWLMANAESIALLADDLCLIRLGTHELLGDLVASVPPAEGWRLVVPADLMSDDELLATLMPTWWSGIEGTLDEYEHGNVDGTDISGLRGVLVGQDHIRHAMRMLVSYRGKAAQPEVARKDCQWGSPSRVEELLGPGGRDKKDVWLVWPGPSANGSCGGVTSAVWIVGTAGRIKPPAVLGGGGAAGFHVGGSESIRLCYYTMLRAIACDNYLWWARRLLGHGQATCSAWHVFMAVACARCWLAEIVETVALLLHEAAHVDAESHCEHGCCQDHMQGLAKERFWALFGAPRDGYADQDRFQAEYWFGRHETGSGGCELYTEFGAHCGIFRLDRRVHVAIGTGLCRWNEPNHFEYDFGYTEACVLDNPVLSPPKDPPDIPPDFPPDLPYIHGGFA